MADANKIESRYHYTFINNVIGSFFKNSLEYFSTYLYPRFNYSLIATYDKTVVYFNNKKNLGRELDKPDLPAIILNPSGDIGISDTGNQLYRFPNIAPGLVKRIYDPIYQDENVLVTVGFTRLKGDFELLILTNSFYEYTDLRLLLIQVFGGTDRVIYPKYFDSFIILPSEIVTYKYENDYTGKTYTLNWENAGAKELLINSTDTTEWVFPCSIKPWYRMRNISDASSKYGGIDNIADWRLSVGVEYEIEVPSYIILESDYLAKHIKMNMRYNSVYSKYPLYQPKQNRTVTKTKSEFGLNEDSNSSISDGTTSIEYVKHLKFKTRYYHIITSDELSSDYIRITLSEEINDLDLLYVNSMYGELKYGDYYTLDADKKTIILNSKNMELHLDDYIEFYIYEKES